MLDLKACAVCFNMSSKLINMDISRLRYDFNILSGLQTYPNHDKLSFLCVECCTYLNRFINFQRRCQRAYFALKSILHKGINPTDLEQLKNSGYDIASPLSYIDLSRIHYEEVYHSVDNHDPISTASGVTGSIPVLNYSIPIKEEIQYITSNTVNENEQDIHTFGQETSNIDTHTFNLDDFDIKSENSKNKDAFEVQTESKYIPTNADDPTLDNFDLEFGNTNSDQYQDTFGQETSTFVEISLEAFDNDSIKSDSENYEPQITVQQTNVPEINKEGMTMVEEYAVIKPLTMTEAHAVMEVQVKSTSGKHFCNICNKRYLREKAFKEHYRRHEKYTNGLFFCEVCKIYFQTNNLLQCHMTEKHMYKYICRKCPEISFDRSSAKKHYYSVHCPTDRRRKRKVTNSTTKKRGRIPDDFLDIMKYTPQRHEEQYQMVLERRHSKNYKESPHKCEFCFQGFLSKQTHSNHMKKHDPTISGKLECDMCKMRYKKSIQMYLHMMSKHVLKYECRRCDFICLRRQAGLLHYRWHKNQTSKKCPHCDKVYDKPTSLSSHIRIFHPTSDTCNICGHSFMSQHGLVNHKNISHTKEEIEKSASEIDPNDVYYCADCDMQFLNAEAFNTHFKSSSKHVHVNIAATIPRHRDPLIKDTLKRIGKQKKKSKTTPDSTTPNKTSPKPKRKKRKSSSCHVCGKFLENAAERQEHFKSEHPGVRYPGRFMCEYCGYIGGQQTALQAHMQKHKKDKAFECAHCNRWFTTRQVLINHVRIHTGEKPYECSYCKRCFRQKITLKLHVRTVHLKIPYPPWDKRNRKRKVNETPPSPTFDFPAYYSTQMTNESEQATLPFGTSGRDQSEC